MCFEKFVTKEMKKKIKEGNKADMKLFISNKKKPLTTAVANTLSKTLVMKNLDYSVFSREVISEFL